MVYTRKRKITTDISLKIDDNLITEVSPTKFLGVYLDNRLTWKKHIDYITAKVSRGFGLISKARKLLNADAMLSLYYSFLYPYLCYCNHVWGSTYASNLQKLIALPKKIIRMIPGFGFRDHTDPLFKNMSLISHLKDSFLRSLTSMVMEQGRMKGYMHTCKIRPCQNLHFLQRRGPLIWNMIKIMASIQMFQKLRFQNRSRNV